MAIHHDKMAYGKLSPSAEELSEEKIVDMLALLNAEDDGDDGGEEKDPLKGGDEK